MCYTLYMDQELLDKINEVRNVAGWSQERFASEVGVTFATFNRWVNLKVKPRDIYVSKINAIYKQVVGSKPISDKEFKDILNRVDDCIIEDIYSVINSDVDIFDELLLQLTYNSNAIEGTTFTLNETQVVIFDKANISNKSLVEHLEIVNHAVLLKDIFLGKFSGPVTEDMIKSFHSNLLRGIREDAGEYSKHIRRIKGVDLVLPHPDDIEFEMQYLIKSYSKQKISSDRHCVDIVSRFHADFEAIHPFGDGNGRVGRLIMIKQLLDQNYPPVLIENKRKADYYDALENAQRKSYNFLGSFICEEIKKTHEIFSRSGL